MAKTMAVEGAGTTMEAREGAAKPAVKVKVRVNPERCTGNENVAFTEAKDGGGNLILKAGPDHEISPTEWERIRDLKDERFGNVPFVLLAE